MTSWEQKWKHKVDLLKTVPMRPLLWVLAKLGVRPNHVSVAGLLLMVAFPFVIRSHPVWALGCLVGEVVLDGLIDGSLSRYVNCASDRGKFVDVLCDTVSFVLLLTGLVVAGLVTPVVGLLYASCNVIYRIIAILKKNRPGGDWIMPLFTGVFNGVTVGLVQISFAVWTFLPQVPVNEIVMVLLILTAAKSIQYVGELS